MQRPKTGSFYPRYSLLNDTQTPFLIFPESPDYRVSLLMYMRRQRHCMLYPLCRIHEDGETSNF